MYHSTVKVHYSSKTKTFNELLSTIKSNLRNSNEYDSTLIEIHDDASDCVVYYLLKIEALNIICCARNINELTNNFETIRSVESSDELRSYDLIKTGDSVIVCIKDEKSNSTLQITTNKITKIISASIFENGTMSKVDYLDINKYNRFNSITVLHDASEMVSSVQKELKNRG